MGNQYCFNTQAPDSALACYTIVSNRYSKYMSKQQRRDCVRANIGKWYVYFFCFFDYAKSYESLSKAEELSTDMPEAISRIYLNFGAMYQTMAEQGKDQKTLRKALSYYKKCFAVSIKAFQVRCIALEVSEGIRLAFGDEGDGEMWSESFALHL